MEAQVLMVIFLMGDLLKSLGLHCTTPLSIRACS